MSDKKILLVANTAWNLWNYRSSLIRALEAAGYTLSLVAPEDQYVWHLVAETKAGFIPLRRLSRKSLSVLQNFLLLLEFWQIFRRERPDIVLFYTIKPNILGNIAAARAAVPVVSVVEGLGYSAAGAAGWRWVTAILYRIAFRRTKKVVFLNNDDCREFRQQGLVRPEQVVVIHGPGIDTARFRPVNRPVNPRMVFLFSGRLLVAKGIREFVAAARALRAEHADADFHVLGAPDPGNPGTIQQAELNAWIQEGLLKYHGHHDDVRPVIAQADVLVLPSYYREGVPRSVLEAMAMEKIIISTDTPGCRDTVEPGKNGFLIPPCNANALLEAMRQILHTSAQERIKMGRFSRQKVLAEFSDARVLPQYLALLAGITPST